MHNEFSNVLGNYQRYKEIILFQNEKIFLNLKLEYGLFPKGFYSLINTFNVKLDINNLKVELSTRAINTFFKIAVNHINKIF